MATTRASGKPSPGFCSRLCGKRTWFCAVSGIDTVVPSTNLTSRSRHRHALGCPAHRRMPTSLARRVGKPGGSRLRASQ
jgi:hypothetical protein